MEQFYTEIQALGIIRHRNVISLIEVFEDDEQLVMVLENVEGGELFDYVVAVGTLREDEAAKFIKQILQAVSFFHRLGIIHRDLKPENILLTRDGKTVKIIDFGLAKIFTNKEQIAKSFLGTKGYLAPELEQSKRGAISGYDGSVDVWSIGVISFILLCGCFPFNSNNTSANQYKLHFPSWANSLSNEAKDFVRKLLATHKEERPSASEALGHPWIVRNTQPSRQQLFEGASSLLSSPQLIPSHYTKEEFPREPVERKEEVERKKEVERKEEEKAVVQAVFTPGEASKHREEEEEESTETTSLLSSEQTEEQEGEEGKGGEDQPEAQKTDTLTRKTEQNQEVRKEGGGKKKRRKKKKKN